MALLTMALLTMALLTISARRAPPSCKPACSPVHAACNPSYPPATLRAQPATVCISRRGSSSSCSRVTSLVVRRSRSSRRPPSRACSGSSSCCLSASSASRCLMMYTSVDILPYTWHVRVGPSHIHTAPRCPPIPTHTVYRAHDLRMRDAPHMCIAYTGAGRQLRAGNRHGWAVRAALRRVP